jgi:hypothetical protein
MVGYLPSLEISVIHGFIQDKFNQFVYGFAIREESKKDNGEGGSEKKLKQPGNLQSCHPGNTTGKILHLVCEFFIHPA